jgi:NTE family protein
MADDLIEPPADRTPRPPRRQGVKRLSLALQGGGSHGAFTWGVLHRLMSDQRIYIDGISGASAGAMNGVVMVDGFIKGRRQGAIDAMERFWHRISDNARLFGADPTTFWQPRTGERDWRVDSHPSFIFMDFITRLFSPSELNPFDINPLRDVLVETIDFERLRRRREMKLFVAASNVRTCRPRVFRTPEMRVECLLASACLPLMFKAVEIDGEYYWDGGYLGNPAIYPLIHECGSSDIVIVQINPMNRPEVPVTAREILNRINEMSFNASLVREMSGIATVSRFVEAGTLTDDRYSEVRFHEISGETALGGMGTLSKMNTERAFLDHLHDLGFDAADRWLEAHFDQIGWESTLDVLDRYG